MYLCSAFCDFEIDENTAIDKDITYKYNSYEDTEIDIDDFKLKDFDPNVIGEVFLEKNFVPQIQFVDEDSIPHVHEEISTKKSSFICESCGKKYVKEYFFLKHISKCEIDNEEREEQIMDADDNDETGQDFFLFS